MRPPPQSRIPIREQWKRAQAFPARYRLPKGRRSQFLLPGDKQSSIARDQDDRSNETIVSECAINSSIDGGRCRDSGAHSILLRQKPSGTGKRTSMSVPGHSRRSDRRPVTSGLPPILLQKSKIERPGDSRESRFLDAPAAARLSGANTKVGGRFGMKGCGPSCRHTRNASAVFKIFVLHPKKTFATISANSGHS